MTGAWEIPVPQALTGWWPVLYAGFEVPVAPSVEMFGGGVSVGSVALSVPPTCEFDGAGKSGSSFGITVPPSLTFTGPPPASSELTIPARITLDMAAGWRLPAAFGLTVPPSVLVGARYGGIPATTQLAVPPRVMFGGRPAHDPETFIFTASPGLWNLPDWCDAADFIVLGGGGGGMAGASGYAHGRGGSPGGWASTTVVRGVDIDRSRNQLIISVGAGGAANGGSGAASTIGVGGTPLAVSSAAGIGGGSSSQYGRGAYGYSYTNPFGHTTTIPNISVDIPANAANYSGWTGCGDSILGGPAAGGAGGAGKLIGGDNGGVGCRGQCWVYCYQLPLEPIVPPPPGPPQLLLGATFSQSGVYGAFNPASFPWMNTGTAIGSWNNSETVASVVAGGAWIQVDCQRTRFVDHIVIGYDYQNGFGLGGTTYTEGCPLRVSTDGVNWRLVATTPVYNTTGSANGLVTIPVMRNARYIRLLGRDSLSPVMTLEFQVLVRGD